MGRWNRKVSESTGFEIPEAGTYKAICVALVGLGTQEDEYKGEVKENERVYLAWELLNVADNKGNPFFVAKEFNFFISPTSIFGKFLGDWRGKKLTPDDDIDVLKLLGAKCLLNVGHKSSKSKDGKDRVNVDILGVSQPTKGDVYPAPTVKPFMWDHDAGPFVEPEWLPRSFGRKIADIIAESLESRGHGAPTAATAAAANPGGRSAKASTAAYGDPDAGRQPGSDDDMPF